MGERESVCERGVEPAFNVILMIVRGYPHAATVSSQRQQRFLRVTLPSSVPFAMCMPSLSLRYLLLPFASSRRGRPMPGVLIGRVGIVTPISFRKIDQGIGTGTVRGTASPVFYDEYMQRVQYAQWRSYTE